MNIGKKAFTLTEILLAMGLMAVLFAIIIPGILYAYNSSKANAIVSSYDKINSEIELAISKYLASSYSSPKAFIQNENKDIIASLSSFMKMTDIKDDSFTLLSGDAVSVSVPDSKIIIQFAYRNEDGFKAASEFDENGDVTFKCIDDCSLDNSVFAKMCEKNKYFKATNASCSGS